LLAGYGDPCVYLNNAGNGVESVDENSSPSECKSTGGQWLPQQPAGTLYLVNQNGMVDPALNQNATAIFSSVASAFPPWLTGSYYFSQKTCAILNHGGIVVLGVGLGFDNPVVAGIGFVGAASSYIGCP
jgi:hypothetical protein